MGRDLEETNRNLHQMVDLALQLQQETGVKLLWACLPVPRTPAGPSLTLRPTCSLWPLLRSGRVWRWPRSSELRDLVSCCCVCVCVCSFLCELLLCMCVIFLKIHHTHLLLVGGGGILFILLCITFHHNYDSVASLALPEYRVQPYVMLIIPLQASPQRTWTARDVRY